MIDVDDINRKMLMLVSKSGFKLETSLLPAGALLLVRLSLCSKMLSQIYLNLLRKGSHFFPEQIINLISVLTVGLASQQEADKTDNIRLSFSRVCHLPVVQNAHPPL